MDQATLIVLRLAKEGFGTIQELWNSSTEDVMNAWEFVKFQSEYEETVTELNRPETK